MPTTLGISAWPPPMRAMRTCAPSTATTASRAPDTATTPPVACARRMAAGSTASTSSVESTPRPPAPAPASAAISDALPRTTVGRAAAACRILRVRKATTPTLTGSSTQGLPVSPATLIAASAASSWWLLAVPRLMRMPSATPANCAASASWSIMAGAAPAASSTLALNCCTTVLVMACTSGAEASRRACRAGKSSGKGVEFMSKNGMGAGHVRGHSCCTNNTAKKPKTTSKVHFRISQPRWRCRCWPVRANSP